MELRHLRYFVAVAEEKSITVAAERRLHTAQPSLSRQLRELETEVGAELMTRSARGIELTAAGKVFLDHARLALAQVEAAVAAARRAAHPEERTLALGFLSGCEPEWLPAVMHVLREELPKIEVTISSKHSPQLADGLATGKLDAAFLRPEEQYPDLVYKVLITEPLVVVLPSDHRLATREAIGPHDLRGRDVHRHGGPGPGPALDHRRLCSTVGYRPEANAQGRVSLHGDVARCVNSGSSVVAGLCSQLPDLVGHQPSACWRGALDRSGLGLPQGQQFSASASIPLAQVDDMITRVTKSSEKLQRDSVP